MTYHINLKDFACDKCQALYIPFSSEISCPRCGFNDPNTNEYHSFVSEVLQSMSAHKIQYGRYVPDAWGSWSLVGRMQMICFRFFTLLEHQKPKDFNDFLNKNIASMELPTETENKFVTNVLTAVYRQYMTQDSPRLMKTGMLSRLKRFISNSK